MFIRIRNRLTLLYTAIFAIFIFGFVGILYFAFSREMTMVLSQEAKTIAHDIGEEQKAPLHSGIELPLRTVVEDDRDIGGQIFSYVYNTEGQLITSDEPVPLLRPFVMDMVNKLGHKQNSIVRKTVNLNNGGQATIMMTVSVIQDNKEILGYLYLGRDVTAYYRVLSMLFPLLVGFSLLFILLAGWLGYWIAGRTIIPLEQSVSRQKDFTANASHELRTPLSVFLVSLDLVLQDRENKLSDLSSQVLQDLKDEAKKMAGMVNHLLTLARADLDVVDLDFINFDLQAVAGQIIRSMSILAEEKEIELNFASPEPLMVFGDLEHLRRLLYLLLDNALKYTPRGGQVNLTLESYLKGLEPEVAIIVQDNGMGIPKEAQERIFDRFFRVDLTHSRQIEGSGLGLSIAQWIVQAHQGSIKVESVAGQGTTIRVKLPGGEHVPD